MRCMASLVSSCSSFTAPSSVCFVPMTPSSILLRSDCVILYEHAYATRGHVHLVADAETQLGEPLPADVDVQRQTKIRRDQPDLDHAARRIDLDDARLQRRAASVPGPRDLELVRAHE